MHRELASGADRAPVAHAPCAGAAAGAPVTVVVGQREDAARKAQGWTRGGTWRARRSLAASTARPARRAASTARASLRASTCSAARSTSHGSWRPSSWRCGWGWMCTSSPSRIRLSRPATCMTGAEPRAAEVRLRPAIYRATACCCARGCAVCSPSRRWPSAIPGHRHPRRHASIRSVISCRGRQRCADLRADAQWSVQGRCSSAH